MFDTNLPFLKDKFLIFDRRYNTSAPEIVGKPFGMIRDLDQIWKTKEIKS